MVHLEEDLVIFNNNNTNNPGNTNNPDNNLDNKIEVLEEEILEWEPFLLKEQNRFLMKCLEIGIF